MSVLRLQEVSADGAAYDIGSVTMVDATGTEGVGVTALHIIEWEGAVYPDALQVQAAGMTYGVEVAGTSRCLDLAALRLRRRHAALPSSDAVPSGGASGSGASGSGASGSGDGASNIGCASLMSPIKFCPNFARQLACGTQVALYGHGFPKCAVEEKVLRGDEPMYHHGRIVGMSMNPQIGVADYDCYPVDSGGAVVSEEDGTLLGIHIEE